MSKLSYKSYSWDKEFEIKGYFSDDKSKVVDHEVNSGILTYSPNEIILEIFLIHSAFNRTSRAGIEPTSSA